MIIRVCTAAALCVLVSLSPAAAAQAKITPAVTLDTSAGGTRIVVVLTSTKPLARSKRPKRVSAVAGGTTYKLTRAAGKVTATKLGTWKSKKTTGAEATKLQGLAGKGISVKITPKKGKATTLSASLPAQGAPSTPTGGTNPTPAPAQTTPTAQPRYPVPGKVVTGMDAFNAIKPYFLNSEFSDCAAGRWPTCQVENRYEHAADFSWEYRRCTPVSGSDINTVGAYTVTGVQQNADGSWVVEYTAPGSANFYHWEVGQNGIANGYYAYNGTVTETMANYIVRTPARLGDCYS